MGGKDWRPFVYGGVASVVAEFGTFPIDTTKTRLQIQGQKNNASYSEVKYRGMLHALVRIANEEGLKALYSGIRPAVLRQATYGTIKIGVYYTAKRCFSKNTAEENMTVNVICGMLAGAVSASIANPTDVLKVRMQAQNGDFVKKPMIDSFMEISKKEGIRGLWRGVGPTAQRAAVIVGVVLPAYDVIKRHFINSNIMENGIYNHFISSFIAGLAGSVASTPIDVVRTRLMNQRNFKAATVGGVRLEAVYTSSLDCLVQTVRQEGFLALYKGFIPTWVRLGPWNIIVSLTYFSPSYNSINLIDMVTYESVVPVCTTYNKS
ncbi:hypothetical protein CHUAL_001426 [Chamberlinius hualienensis]